jgi:multidrug efflux pump subunit AcrB
MSFDMSKWALNNQRVVALFIAILTLGGLVSYYALPKLEDPEIVVRQAVVVGIYPGASSHQVELEVTDVLEKSIRKVNGVDFIQSTSYADMCYLLVSLDTKVPTDEIQNKWTLIRNRLDEAELPGGVQVMVKDDFGDVAGMFYSLTGDGMDSKELESYAELVKRELQVLDGVGRIDIYGKTPRCINVSLRQDRLATLGVLPAEVIATLNGQNANVYAGYLQSGGRRIRISVDDRYQTPDDISNLLLQGHHRDQVRLGDIADVTIDDEKTQRAEMLRDGEHALGFCISAQSGTDITKVGRRVEKKIEQLSKNQLPAGLSIEKVFFQPDRVETALGTFILNLIESVLLVIVLLIFCMNFRSGLILGITLVVTVLGTILMLYYFDGTLQRVSLGSFILAMGMLVDNAIVIVDGILVDKRMGKSRSEALTSIGRKTAIPLLGATLIAILAFMPIYLSPDVTGLYVHDMFIVLAVSLLLSWILALVLVPLLAGRWLMSGKEVAQTGPTDASKLYDNVWYRSLTKVLNRSLNHRKLTLGLMVVLLAVVGLCAQFMPQALFPDMNYDQLYMEYQLPEGYGTSQVKADLEKIRQELMSKDYVKHVTTSVGGTPCRYNLVRSVALPTLSYGELIVDFESPRALHEHIEELQKHFSAEFPDAYLIFKRYNLMFMRYPIDLQFAGPDPAVLHQLADSAKAIAEQTGVLSPYTTDWDPRYPVLHIDYKQSSARQKGITRSDVALSLMSATDGLPVGSFYDGIDSYNIYVGITDVNGQPMSNVSNATVFGMLPNLNGLTDKDRLIEALKQGKTPALTNTAQLNEVGDGVKLQWEEPVIPRYNGRRVQSITGSPAPGYGIEEARQILAKEVEKMQLPDGYSIKWGGEKLATDMSMENLFANYPLAVLLMIGILVWLFSSYRTALLLFCCIPFVFVGVVPAMLLSGFSFGFVSIVGVLGLVGMMLKNGIVLVDEVRLQLQGGKSGRQALIDSSLSRLRPVTMASLTTVLGMVPLLFDDMFGSMAAAIMGGLIAGTIIVLIIIPVLYSLFYKLGDARE